MLLILLLSSLVKGDLLECETALIKDPLNAILNGDSDQTTLLVNRFLLSGHRVNDLGQYRGCEHKADDSHYILVKLGENKFWGLCVPYICSADDILQLAQGKFNLLTRMLGS
jgi:hypothetical protein